MRNPRYPGPKPFQTQEHALFFGRDKEISDLHRLVGSNKITVLFGKSGYGKSSLLYAGLMPQLNSSQWITTVIRFGLYDIRRKLTLCESLKKQLEQYEKLKYTEGGTFLESTTLWTEFKKRHDETRPKTVLIFDQFEEFFSYPVEQQEAFQREIADVLYTPLPPSVVKGYQNDTYERQEYLATPMDIRALFAIRADRLSLLHGLKNYLPSILFSRYELKGLTPEQARQAIEKPAAETEGEFDSPSFTYEPEALDWMTEQLSASKATTQTELQVEAVQLQIICQEIENKIRKGTLKSPVTKANLPEFEAILENYYRQEIAALDPSVQYPARIIVEEKLISGQLEDGSARRATVDGSILAQELSIDESLLMTLVDVHLLRREPNSVGSYSYEICHDTLLEPILKARKERQDAEARIAEAKRQAEEAQKAAVERSEMQKKLDEATRKRLLASRLTAASIIVSFLVIGLAIYAYKLYRKAKIIGDVALIGNYIMRQEPSEALSLAYWSFEDNETPEAQKALGDAFYAFLNRNDGCIVQKIENPPNIESWVQSATFTEGGKGIEIQYDSTALVWDLATMTSEAAMPAKEKTMSDSASLFNGQLTVRTHDTFFTIVDKRQTPIFTKTYTVSENIRGVALSPDGSRVLVIHPLKVYVWFWQSQSMAILRGSGGDVSTAVFSPDNKSVLTSTKDGKVMIWNTKGDLLNTLPNHDSEVRSAIFSNDGSYILTASKDLLLRVYQRSNLNLVDTFRLKENPHRLAMTTDGQHILVTIEQDSTTVFSFSKGKISRLNPAKKVAELTWLPYHQEEMHLSPTGTGRLIKFGTRSYDGQLVGAFLNGNVKILNTNGEVIGAFKTPNDITDISFSPDNRFMVVAYGSDCAILPLNQTIHKWLIDNHFPKISSEQ